MHGRGAGASDGWAAYVLGRLSACARGLLLVQRHTSFGGACELALPSSRIACSSSWMLLCLSYELWSHGTNSQRCCSVACRFYPLYPGPLGTCLDLTGDAALELQQLPDLMLLPSDLAPFAKVVTAAAATEAGGAFHPPAAEGELLGRFCHRCLSRACEPSSLPRERGDGRLYLMWR